MKTIFDPPPVLTLALHNLPCAVCLTVGYCRAKMIPYTTLQINGGEPEPLPAVAQPADLEIDDILRYVLIAHRNGNIDYLQCYN
jgi:hypothetical protein